MVAAWNCHDCWLAFEVWQLDDRRRLWRRLDWSPGIVDQQRLSVSCDLLRLGEDVFDRLGIGILVASDELASEGQHQVVAVVSVGGESVVGQLALDCERGLQLLRDQLERVGLQGLPIGHEHHLTGRV